MQKFFIIGALLIASLIASCGFGSDSALSSDQTERRSDGLVYEINSDTPYTGLIKDAYPGGQTQSERNLVNGKPDGRMTRWYENGQKNLESNYVNGRQDGLMTESYENGRKKTEVNMVNGKRDGLVTTWYENGQKRIEKNYANGEPEGDGTVWDEDGNIL